MLLGKEDLQLLPELRKKWPTQLFTMPARDLAIFNMHIPKTGGTFFESFFSKFPVNFYHNNHLKCNPKFDLYPDPTDSIARDGMFQNQPGFKNSLKVAIVRNPFDWLTSYYFHEEGSEDLPWSMVRGVGNCRAMYTSFEDFVEAYCDDSFFWPKGLRMFKKFYPFQIFEESGNCCADIIIKNGSNNELYQSTLELALIMGIPTSISKVAFQESNLRKSRLKNKNYKEYYNAFMIEKLSKKWKNILDVFGFDFNGSTNPGELFINGNQLFLDQDLKPSRRL